MFAGIKTVLTTNALHPPDMVGACLYETTHLLPCRLLKSSNFSFASPAPTAPGNTHLRCSKRSAAIGVAATSPTFLRFTARQPTLAARASPRSLWLPAMVFSVAEGRGFVFVMGVSHMVDVGAVL